jgi:hypothetical protein
MEGKRDDTQRSGPRPAPERAPSGVPEPDDLVRWVTAGVVAAAALLGLLVLVTIVVYALQPPGWLQTILGLAMTAGAVFFAWLLASALRKDDAERPGTAPRRR